MVKIRPSLLLVVVSCSALFHDVYASSEWSVDHSRSKLGFIATYDGVGFETRFRRFSAIMKFDPQNLSDSLFDVTVDITSVDSRSPDRDEGMLEPEWFDARRFPESRFLSSKFRQLGAVDFEVSGSLSIKGTTHAITLPFQWIKDQDGVRMRGKTTLQRTRFQIGTGDWQTDSTIGFDVQVIVDLQLRSRT